MAVRTCAYLSLVVGLLTGCAGSSPPPAAAAPPAAAPRAAVNAPAPATPAEQGLHRDIRGALQRAGVDASSVRIHVQGGIVQLSGSVRSLAQKAQARQAVLAVQGVSSVSVDGLTVTSAVGH